MDEATVDGWGGGFVEYPRSTLFALPPPCPPPERGREDLSGDCSPRVPFASGELHPWLHPACPFGAGDVCVRADMSPGLGATDWHSWGVPTRGPPSERARGCVLDAGSPPSPEEIGHPSAARSVWDSESFRMVVTSQVATGEDVDGIRDRCNGSRGGWR